jgi:hypothetical protein
VRPAARDTEVVFYVNDRHRFSRAEQRAIQTIAEADAADARRLLPDLPHPAIGPRSTSTDDVLDMARAPHR